MNKLDIVNMVELIRKENLQDPLGAYFHKGSAYICNEDFLIKIKNYGESFPERTMYLSARDECLEIVNDDFDNEFKSKNVTVIDFFKNISREVFMFREDKLFIFKKDVLKMLTVVNKLKNKKKVNFILSVEKAVFRAAIHDSEDNIVAEKELNFYTKNLSSTRVSGDVSIVINALLLKKILDFVFFECDIIEIKFNNSRNVLLSGVSFKNKKVKTHCCLKDKNE